MRIRAADEVRIENVSVTTDTVTLNFDTGSDTNYYRVLRGDSPERINTPVFLSFGGMGRVSATDNVPSAKTLFYRLQRVPRSAPLDSDGDGIDDDWELHVKPLNALNASDANTIDPNGNGYTYLQRYIAATTPLTTIAESSPSKGESGVAVTRETVFRLSQSLAASAVISTNNLYATFGGRRILSRIELASDRKTVTLFYREHLPASARVRVTFDGTGIIDHVGRQLDPDGDGQAGGVAITDFDTLSTTPIAGTAITGQVFASEQIVVNGLLADQPLEHVQISVVGDEQNQHTFTDAQGYFNLSPCPAGKFFVIIEGKTAVGSVWPGGSYYATVTKPWEAVAGRTNNLAAGTGRIFLPFVVSGTLQPVSATTNTTIVFPPEVVQKNPLLAGVTVTVPANTLYDESGVRGGLIGMTSVASDRLPEPLPQGINHALDISIQTGGPQNLDRPLPVRFPNLPDPKTGVKLPPGAKTALMSYNHDTGRWEIQGPMTVTADGTFVESDSDVGVRQPGWHGTMAGTQGSGGPISAPGGGGPSTGPGAGGPGNSPNGNPPCQGDLDCDGIPDAQDSDRDGDGIPNDSDPDPDDPTNPSQPLAISGPPEVWIGSSQVYSIGGALAVADARRSKTKAQNDDVATWSVSGATIVGPASGNQVVVEFPQGSSSSTDAKVLRVTRGGKEASVGIVVGSASFENTTLNLLREAQASNRLLLTPTDFSLDPAPSFAPIDPTRIGIVYDQNTKIVTINNLIPRLNCDAHAYQEFLNAVSAASTLGKVELVFDKDFADLWFPCLANRGVEAAIAKLNNEVRSAFKQWLISKWKAQTGLSDARIDSDANYLAETIVPEILAKLNSSVSAAQPQSSRIRESTTFEVTATPSMNFGSFTVSKPINVLQPEWFNDINIHGWDSAAATRFSGGSVPISFNVGGQTAVTEWNFQTTVTTTFTRSHNGQPGEITGTAQMSFSVRWQPQ